MCGGGSVLGSILGGAVGFLVGGPAGAAIGAGLGGSSGMQYDTAEQGRKQQQSALNQQNEMQQQSLAQAQQQAQRQEQAVNAANRRAPVMANLLERAGGGAPGGGAGTMLTGPMGVNPADLQLGRSTLLGS